MSEPRQSQDQSKKIKHTVCECPSSQSGFGLLRKPVKGIHKHSRPGVGRFKTNKRRPAWFAMNWEYKLWNRRDKQMSKRRKSMRHQRFTPCTRTTGQYRR
ncbi:hypothetical protein L596_007577 [Steinernema carpocapsae]|uniref:Uncharacterized protein n=1 Tax=Steinernema carpocapsae TaxID=34508 RepID=A0A4V6A616_STECR|nr:hypothetical protein L596_007577 [Steinernema carpocapsae]